MDNIDIILEKFYNRFNKFNTKVLEELGNVIKQFDNLTPSQAHRLAQELKYSNNINSLLKELSDISEKSIKELHEYFEKVASENVEFSRIYYEYKDKEYTPYERNEELVRLVKSIEKETDGLFKNLSNSKNIGFSYKDQDGKIQFKQLKDVYNDLVDEASYNVAIGVKDYQSAMRNVIKKIADSGVKIHEDKVAYESGYNRRIDSSVRQNVLTGLRKININIQEQIGKELDSDGVEISAHSPCADDHLFLNGKQFSKKEFDKINGDLERPIGEYNCRHFVFSIILGVSQPSYTKKQLKEMEKESLSKVEYEGKTYTKYQATQVQRKIETEIRKQKDRQIMARASGNKDEVGDAQDKIQKLTNKYNDFSNKAGLETYKERLSVSGYRKVKVNNK